MGTGAIGLLIHYVLIIVDMAQQYYSGDVVLQGRIMLLDRTDLYYPRHIEINGATSARNPNSTADVDNLLQCSAETWLLMDVTYPGKFSPEESRLCRATRCKFLDVELDKLCDRVELIDCQTTSTLGVHAGTGINDLLIERCRIDNGTIEVSPPSFGSSQQCDQGAIRRTVWRLSVLQRCMGQ